MAAHRAARGPPSCSAHWDGLRKKATSPRGRPETRSASHPTAAGECGPPDDTTEGSIMDAKTGANIKTGKFIAGGKETSFPIYDGTIGPAVIDIGKFYAETG